MGTEKARVPPSLLMASCPLLLLQSTPGMGINRDFALSHYWDKIDWVKEAKNRQQGVGQGRAGWAALEPHGQEGIALWGWQLTVPCPTPTSHRQQTPH